MNVNIGGDRLGSGAKINVDLHNYSRSTHDLSKKFQSSLAPGLLYPAYVNVGLNGDKWEIDIESITRTLPTQGPLFGSYKMQVDCFVTPIRLYQGILHNNPINIGLKMADIKLPKITLHAENRNSNLVQLKKPYQVNPSNIWKYFGLSGLGKPANNHTQPLVRKINALPLLAYYDIFKNYYANKQEDNAYVVSAKLGQISFTDVFSRINNGSWNKINTTSQGANYFEYGVTNATIDITIYGENLDPTQIPVTIQTTNTQTQEVKTGTTSLHALAKAALNAGANSNWKFLAYYVQEDHKMITFTTQRTNSQFEILLKSNVENVVDNQGINLTSFPLENIDKMREAILQETQLGSTFLVNETNLLPYTLNSVNSALKNLSSPMVGLVCKTYQSDIFNNWLNSEVIDGDNGIREITKVDTSNGLELDALNLAQKVYNMLNRIAVTGGTYEDWQEAVYTQSSIRKAETPMYMGGMSCEVMFEEVIATTADKQNPERNQELGSLGGRGKQFNSKGGHIEFNIEEPSIIMVLVSLTPRITYSQGNKWYLTDLDSINDLHKPALDGIGFQDLMTEQLAFTGTTINQAGEVTERLTSGKTVAWINYMTDVNECYGDFAAEEGAAYMVLNRNYNIIQDDKFVAPTDVTTYIDPQKYNYAFAINSLDAQNFWNETQFNIKCRRLMSAKQIPNL